MSNSKDVHEAYFGEQHVTTIEPPAGWRMLDFREIWAYRELFWVLASRDVKVRYRQTVLGASWAIIRPLVGMVVFSGVFGVLAKLPSDGLPYPIFVYAGLLAWSFFASAVGACGNSLVGSGHLVSKVYFPRIIIPIAAIGTHLVDLAVATSVLLLMMLYYGQMWTANLLWAPLLLLILVLAVLGIGTCFAAMTVSYRDVAHLIPFIVQSWMFLTPVVYPLSMVPERWRWLARLNPMTGIVEGFRACFLGRPFDWAAIGFSAFVTLVMLALGIAYFERVERRFADVI